LDPERTVTSLQVWAAESPFQPYQNDRLSR
jgi:hypothetical protein